MTSEDASKCFSLITSCYLTLEAGVLTAPSLYFITLVLFVKKKPDLFQRNEQHYAGQMSMITRGRGDLRIPLHNSTFFERGPQFKAIKT